MIRDLILSAVLGYLIGAIPTGFVVAKLAKGVTIYSEGSGHTGGLNVTRTVGLWAGILTAIVDVLLGFAAVGIAYTITHENWMAVIAGVLAIIGHNWSVYIKFRGGIGISKTLGSIGYLFTLITLELTGILLIIWLLLHKVIHLHRARTTVVSALLIGPILWLLGASLHGIVLGTVRHTR